MKNTKSTLFLVFILFLFSALYAVPAIPYPVTVTQPDGTELTVRLKGDERMSWHESMDGYTLLLNNEAFLTYAYLDDEGNLQPSAFVATDIENRNSVVNSFLHTINKNLFYSDMQRQFMLKVWEIEDDFETRGDRALEGQYKTLCAFVQFPDRLMTKTLSQFEGLMNQLGYVGGSTGSVRDFFKESSYGKFDLVITLCGVYTAPNNASYYAKAGGVSSNCPALARWAAQQVVAEPDINFADYDSDNNGKVDGFHFIFAGMGQEMGGTCTTCIWSHKWEFSPAVTKNGKSISVYSCSPELLTGSTITTIGVICHEMTHAFGAPDFYDTDGGTGENNYKGTGQWDLMAEGSWNGNYGSCPAHHNMYTKVKFGWVTPTLLSAPITILDMPNSTENPVAFKITVNGNEHYLLENRQKIKFDVTVPGSGLIIYHVHSTVETSASSNNINATHPQKMYPVCASSTVAIPVAGASNYGTINSAGCPFPGTSGKTSFDENSTPRMFQWTNTVVTGKPITNIYNNTSTRMVSFDFMGGGESLFFVTTQPNILERGTTTGTGWYTENSSVTVNATPKTGYNFTNWTESGTIVSETTSYTFNITKTTKLVANFTSNNALLSNLTVSTGTLVPAFNTDTTNYTVRVPNSATFITISCTTADMYATVEGAGYKSLEVGNNNFTITVTAEDKITMKQYTVNVIRESENKYTITASVENNIGGTISPDGENIVVEGESLSFTITPFDKYKISNVLVNKENKGDITTYTFENILSDGTIHVIFIEDVGIINNELPNINIYSHQNRIYIKNESNVSIKSVEIVDMMGRLIYQNEINNVETVIPLYVETGIYNVILYNKDLSPYSISKLLITK